MTGMVVDAVAAVVAEDRRRRRRADPFAPRPPSAAALPAPRIRPLRALAGALAGLLYGLGWLVGVILWPVAFAVLWLAAAVGTGWLDARLVYIRDVGAGGPR